MKNEEKSYTKFDDTTVARINKGALQISALGMMGELTGACISFHTKDLLLLWARRTTSTAATAVEWQRWPT